MVLKCDMFAREGFLMVGIGLTFYDFMFGPYLVFAYVALLNTHCIVY